MKIIQGTQAYEVLRVIGCTVEYPRQALNLMEGHTGWVKRVVRQLLKERYISIYKRGRTIRSLRVLQKGQQAMRDAGVNEMDFYKPERVDGDAKKLYRTHRTAESWVMMKRAGVTVYPSEKPTEFNNQGQPLYYTSSELKYNQDVTQNVSGSKFTGILMTGGQNTLVYNTHNSLMNWNTQKEQAVGTYYLYEGVPISSSIIFGRDMSTVSEIFKSNGRKGKRESVLQADTGFTHSYFIPVSSDGIRLLKLMSICRAV